MNTVLGCTGATRYVWLCDILFWVGIYICLDEHYYGNNSAHDVAFGTNL